VFGKGRKEARAGLRYPLHFVDFETFAAALPRYEGMSPYDQTSFQWSVNIQCKPGAELEQYELLANDSTHSRQEFVKALCQVIGQKGRILA
jgi:hypothetical protein